MIVSKNSLTLPKQCQVHNIPAEFRHILVQMRVQRVQCRHIVTHAPCWSRARREKGAARLLYALRSPHSLGSHFSETQGKKHSISLIYSKTYTLA